MTAKVLHRVFSLVVVALAVYWIATRIDLAETWTHVRGADFRWFGAGFALFFLSLPLRAWRWRILLANLGHRVPVTVLAAIIFRAWTVNCAVPGRAGDLYGAYAVNRTDGIDGGRALGTIFTARVLDVMVLVVLIGVMALLGVHQAFPPLIATAVNVAVILGAAVLAGLAFLRVLGGRAARFLPERLAGLWERFRTAIFDSLGKLPLLLPLTVALWLLEGARLWCVLRAIGPAPDFGPVMFLALAAAVLTTLPVTPGGLGTVEALYQRFLPELGMTASAAAGAAILDRVINYWFILLAGALYFILRGGTAAPAETESPDE